MRESNKELISLNGKMKIYFAGSIRGGRKDAELYRKIIYSSLCVFLLTFNIYSSNPLKHL